MKDIDVIFYEAFKEEEVALKKLLPKIIKAVFTPKTIQEEVSFEPPASIISIRTQSRIPIAWSKKVKGILARSQGYEHLVNYRREAKTKIPCGYLSDYCSRSVAEHAVMMMLVLLKHFKKQTRQLGQFDRDGITGLDCFGKKALVFGVGHIGAQIVDLLKGLKMTVKGIDVKQNLKTLKYVSLPAGIKWADILFCAAALTGKTEKALNYSVLKKAKPGLVLINVSRGEITPSEDMKRLLDEKFLGGLALDVYPDESYLADYLRDDTKDLDKNIQTILELKDLDNVICTPHNAFNTRESVQQKAKQSVESLKYFLKKGKFPHAVIS